MASSEQRPRGMSRRFVWLAIGIVAAIALYTAGWFYAAGRLEEQVAATLTRINAGGAEAVCTDATVRGYPFRIGVYCDEARYRDAARMVAISGRALRNAAQIYQPRRIVGELDQITVEPVAPLALSAKDIRYSARLAEPLPERISAAASELAVYRQPAADIVARAASGQAHLRRNGADVDLAGNFQELVLAITAQGGEPVPPLDGEADIGIADGVRLLGQGAVSLRGLSGDIRALKLTGGEATATVVGPFAIGQDGLVDATLTVSLVNPKALAAILAASFPQIRPQVVQASSLIAALGSNPQLPLAIQKGVVRMGFVTLGRIPPL